MKTISFAIGPDGKVKIETNGFVGSECADATRAVEAALAGDKTEEKKPEFFQQNRDNVIKQGS